MPSVYRELSFTLREFVSGVEDTQQIAETAAQNENFSSLTVASDNMFSK